MALEIQREGTVYVYYGVDGTVPSVSAEVAHLAAGTRPTVGDWETAIIVGSDAHALWADATASGATGDYFVAILIGTYNGNTYSLPAGDYQPWIRPTDTTEQPVLLAPTTLTVA